MAGLVCLWNILIGVRLELLTCYVYLSVNIRKTVNWNWAEEIELNSQQLQGSSSVADLWPGAPDFMSMPRSSVSLHYKQINSYISQEHRIFKSSLICYRLEVRYSLNPNSGWSQKCYSIRKHWTHWVLTALEVYKCKLIHENQGVFIYPLHLK